MMVLNFSCNIKKDTNAEIKVSKKITTKNSDVSNKNFMQHFISIEIYAIAEWVGASKKVGEKRFSGDGGGVQGISSVLNEPVEMKNGKVYFKYEFTNGKTIIYKCSVNKKDIMKTPKGKELKVNADCKILKEATNK